MNFPEHSTTPSQFHIAVHTPQILLPVVSPLPLSLATTRGISVDFFSSPYLDVSVREVPHVTLWIHVTLHDSSSWGFPHSEIHGSKLICSSPWLIAACRVLLRLLMPRHSPCALFRLNFSQRINNNRKHLFVYETQAIQENSIDRKTMESSSE